jgi:pullulanase
MKRIVMLFGFLTQLFSGKGQKSVYDKYPFYPGNDLGVTYSKEKTIFKVWAPSATEARVYIYKGNTDHQVSAEMMRKDKYGVWLFEAKWDLKGYNYGFRTLVDNKWSDIVPDPCTKAVNVNGKRGAIIDLKETNPTGWASDKSPVFNNKTDAIIYELHVRDASIATNSGIMNKGKFLGLTEAGTKNAEGFSTGLDHLKELGVTHVHLLPLFDFNSIDETKPDVKYNWGYDPLNYNVPEGSYSTNANDPVARIKEFKKLVQTFHKNGLRVVMDVVYNHTALSENSNFNQLVPGYYYRQSKDGKFSNATACGNETASERPMMRKFILESMKYWVQEYHIDGFRIDLMGVHDTETMNLVSKELHKIKPDILLYGEGWTAGASPLPDSLRALKSNVSKLDRIAVFSDDIRDGIKGHVFTPEAKGFASGLPGTEESVKFGIVAGCKHPQVDYSKVNYSKKPYALQPWQTVTYAECHDNHCLYDKLAISAKEATEEERVEMQKLALSIVLTSQGITFLHAGSEFLRTKQGVENSFESPDSINAIDWGLKSKNKYVFEYVKALIKMRKEHPAFRMTTAKQIASNLRFVEGMPAGVIAYTINGAAVGDKWKKIFVAFNGTGKDISIRAQPGSYKCFIAGNMISETIGGYEGYWRLDPYSCSILFL